MMCDEYVSYFSCLTSSPRRGAMNFTTDGQNVQNIPLRSGQTGPALLPISVSSEDTLVCSLQRTKQCQVLVRSMSASPDRVLKDS